MGKRILLVDDEPLILKGLKYTLEQEGYETDSAMDGEEALLKFETGAFDLILLDVMLPKMDGIAVCQRIRERSDIPIIMLTAKGEDMDKILGLEYGADDYMTKPFNILEVKARIKTILRRVSGGMQQQEHRVIRVHDMEVNLIKRSVTLGGRDIKLTAKEFDLLQMFVTNRGTVFSREQMLETVWKYDYAGDARTVDVHIRRLREKIERDTSKPEFRWKILLAFFLIVGLSFFVAATTLTDLVSNYLFEQRKRDDILKTEKLALATAPLFQSVSANELNELLEEEASSMDGRLMLIDNDGKIQYDSFQELCGQRIQVDEALRILAGDETEDYNIHEPGQAVVEKMSGESGADYVAYSAHEMTGFQGRIGVALYVGRVQNMMDSLKSVRIQLLSVFAVIAVAALVVAMFLSRILTNPITALSRTMRKMGKGDLSVRVPVRGSGELRELANNYNTMAAQLESLDKTRNQFVSNASHELKTPLATMKILLESMIYQPDMPDEVRADFMKDMNHEIDRLTGIVTDLLVLTRMDNREDMKRDSVNMSELTRETIRLLTPAAEQNRQTLREDIQDNLFLYGDRSKLNQILYNLTDNAIKYTPEKGTISVSLREENGDIVWRVKDNGIGIPPDDQEHIFERFYRVDKARGRETGGTGLGLSIVKQMVKMHDGTISVHSEPGKGSEFIVTFPQEGEAP